MIALFHAIRMTWRRRQRAMDLKYLWPSLAANASDLNQARLAFAEHAMTDPAWLELGETALLDLIFQLEAADGRNPASD